MQINKEDITSFLTFRHALSDLKKFNYDYPMRFSAREIEFDDAKAQVALKLKDAILSCIEGHKKIGVMMSCGVDSLLVAKLLRERAENAIIYTAKFKGDDECDRAVEAVKETLQPLQHKVIEVEPSDYLDTSKWLVPLLICKGEPLHPNEIALAKAERQAAIDGCDVVLCGEGSDDIFAGYSKIATWFKKPKIEFMEFYRYFSMMDRMIVKDNMLVHDVPLMEEVMKGVPEDEYYYRHFIQKIHTPGLLKRGRNAGRLSHLEVKFPYMNKDLVNFANSLPLEYHIFGHKVKYILREAAELFGLPKKYAYSPKHPFPVPLQEWTKDIKACKLNQDVFEHNDVSTLSGWHKWMLINLNEWINLQ